MKEGEEHHSVPWFEASVDYPEASLEHKPQLIPDL
jgi:hypothetical protein